MVNSGGPTRVPDARAVEGGGVPGALRTALHALVRGARAHRLQPGGLELLRVTDAARTAWLCGMQEALAGTPVVVIGVAPAGLWYGEIPVLDGAERDVADTLHAAGVRGLAVFAGVGEDELLQLARILLTAWPPPGQGDADLEAALWGLEMPHVHVERVVSETGGDAELRTPGRLRGAGTGGERTAEGAVVVGTLTDEASAELRRLRDTAAPEPASLMNVKAAGAAIPPELAAEAASVRSGADLTPGAVGGTLIACLARETDPDRVPVQVHALLGYVLDLLGGPTPPSAPLHKLLEHLDPELDLDAPLREEIRLAAQALARPPLRDRLLRVLADAGENDLRGELFSLFSLVSEEEAVRALAEALPRWAARVLADAVLVRETVSGAISADAIRSRLGGAGTGELLMALAMAARSDDPKLIEPVFAHADHADPAVREAVLFALRKQRAPRVRDLVKRRLEDPAEPVRVEALRYCVAYRDAEVAPKLEARLAAAADLGDAEARALCLALARLARDRAEGALIDLATGRRAASSPSVPKYALHALKAVGTTRARAAIQQVAATVPALADDAKRLLEEGA
ncbi:MAG: HEAT repeat domain-containing protein [Myxococcota bacterium]